MSSALKKITVLDFSRLIPGPYCTKILADRGARVIKIEDCNRPDLTREIKRSGKTSGSPLDHYLNGKKKRLCLDFNLPRHQKKITELIKKADVLVESFRPGVMDLLGLSVKKVHQLNPRLIYVSLTGYGQKSKLSGKAGHDINFMAEAGLLADFLPTLPRYQIADFIGGGLFAAFEILTALLEGKKRVYLDVAMTESMRYLSLHRSLKGVDGTIDLIAGKLARYHLYKSRDKKWIALGALEEKFWRRLCKILMLNDLQLIGFDVKKNLQAVKVLESVFGAKDARFWRTFAGKHDVCLTVVYPERARSIRYAHSFRVRASLRVEDRASAYLITASRGRVSKVEG